MSDYLHTDEDGGRFYANTWPGESVRIQVEYADGTHGRAVHKLAPEDAPDVALAILEAAGIEGQAPGSHEEQAAFHLAHAVAIRNERTEREAEDAKVRGWLRIICAGRFIRDTYTPSELERTTYRAARDFFRESP